MRIKFVSPSRRNVLIGLTTLTLTPIARAQPRARYPLEMLYARIGPTGFEHVPSVDQDMWEALQFRLGGLIQRVEPIQTFSTLPVNPPEVDGGASCALTARKLAQDAGVESVLIYSVNDGRTTYPSFTNWLSRAYAHIRSELTPRKDTTAEAHLLSVNGGAPLLSVSVDAPAKSFLKPLGALRHPETEALETMTKQLERRFQSQAAELYRSSRSIAD